MKMEFDSLYPASNFLEKICTTIECRFSQNSMGVTFIEVYNKKDLKALEEKYGSIHKANLHLEQIEMVKLYAVIELDNGKIYLEEY